MATPLLLSTLKGAMSNDGAETNTGTSFKDAVIAGER